MIACHLGSAPQFRVHVFMNFTFIYIHKRSESVFVPCSPLLSTYQYKKRYRVSRSSRVWKEKGRSEVVCQEVINHVIKIGVINFPPVGTYIVRRRLCLGFAKFIGKEISALGASLLFETKGFIM